MKKISEIKFNSEYPKIFISVKNVFFADEKTFGTIINNRKLLMIKKFEVRFEIRNLDGKYFYLDNYTEDIGHLFDIQENTFTNIMDFTTYEIINGNKDYCLIINRKAPETLLFGIEKEQILWKQDKYFSFQIYDNELLIDNEKNKLVRYDFHTGLPLWQYALPEGVYSQGSNYPPAVSKEIASILGVYANTLWIVSDMGHLIGIESETGECKYHLKTPINLPAEWENWEVFINAKKSFIDTEKGIIFGLDYPNYWECDLNNPAQTYLLYNISATSQEHNITPDFQGNWLGDEVFFGQNSFAKDPTYIGIFNRKTRQITWTSRELGEEGIFKGIQKIEYQDNRLYVLDRASTLHIFEREG